MAEIQIIASIDNVLVLLRIQHPRRAGKIDGSVAWSKTEQVQRRQEDFLPQVRIHGIGLEWVAEEAIDESQAGFKTQYPANLFHEFGLEVFTIRGQPIVAFEVKQIEILIDQDRSIDRQVLAVVGRSHHRGR